MYDYKINRSGLRRMMTSDSQLHGALLSSAREVLAIARSLAPVDTRPNRKPPVLRESGRVEDLGIRGVKSGEPRMTVAVVFHTRYAMDAEKRTGFLSGAIARGRKR